jgi:hypothetical protein
MNFNYFVHLEINSLHYFSCYFRITSFYLPNSSLNSQCHDKYFFSQVLNFRGQHSITITTGRQLQNAWTKAVKNFHFIYGLKFNLFYSFDFDGFDAVIATINMKNFQQYSYLIYLTFITLLSLLSEFSKMIGILKIFMSFLLTGKIPFAV